MGSLTTWGLLGMVLGGAVGGIMSDKLGRKKMLIIAVIFYGIFTLPQAFANDLVFFAAFRLIAGFGVAPASRLSPRCSPRACLPSSAVSSSPSAWPSWLSAGFSRRPRREPDLQRRNRYHPGLCNQITYTLADGSTAQMFTNWRVCYLIGALPIVYGIVLIFAMHETPHWYANSGNKEMVCKRLTQIEQATRHTSHEYDPALLVVPPKPAKVGPTVLFSLEVHHRDRGYLDRLLRRPVLRVRHERMAACMVQGHRLLLR